MRARSNAERLMDDSRQTMTLGRLSAGALLAGSLLLVPSSFAETFSLGSPVSPAGQIVAEFSASRAPANPKLMAASAIQRNGTGPLNDIARDAVYVSHNGGSSWSEVPAWPDGGLHPGFDPQVFIDQGGVIHASGIGETEDGARVLYTRSADHG